MEATSTTDAPATGGSGESGSPSTTSPDSGGGSLASLDPCEMLTDSQKSELGVTGQAEPDETTSAKYCKWRVDANPAVPGGYQLALAVFPELGLDRVNAVGEKTPVPVGSRRAIQSLRAGGGVCAISIEVTATSRVDVQASGGDGKALCPAALDAAKVVEPELP
ncbi:DUF3558 domain-containing protein [Actinokineospora sp. PR83]|nr:DUF3558 domain-containing protein [Actinokineospora sp. PR83]